MSTLSVEISTTVSPCLTASPTLTLHSRIVPSVTDSPPVGVTMSISSPLDASAAATPSASVAAPATASDAVAGGDSPETGVPPTPVAGTSDSSMAAAAVGRYLGQRGSDGDGVALGGVDLHDPAGGR